MFSNILAFIASSKHSLLIISSAVLAPYYNMLWLLNLTLQHSFLLFCKYVNSLINAWNGETPTPPAINITLGIVLSIKGIFFKFYYKSNPIGIWLKFIEDPTLMFSINKLVTPIPIKFIFAVFIFLKLNYDQIYEINPLIPLF